MRSAFSYRSVTSKEGQKDSTSSDDGRIYIRRWCWRRARRGTRCCWRAAQPSCWNVVKRASLSLLEIVKFKRIPCLYLSLSLSTGIWYANECVAVDRVTICLFVIEWRASRLHVCDTNRNDNRKDALLRLETIHTCWFYCDLEGPNCNRHKHTHIAESVCSLDSVSTLTATIVNTYIRRCLSVYRNTNANLCLIERLHDIHRDSQTHTECVFQSTDGDISVCQPWCFF